MQKNRRNSIKRERTIMIVSSIFVLGALTLTGIYMNQGEEENKNDGYTVDFTALEESPEENLEQIAQNNVADSKFDTASDALDYYPENMAEEEIVSEPVGSGDVENPEIAGDTLAKEDAVEEPAPVSAGESVVAKELHFSQEQGILRPVNGEVLLPYSMDASIYFATLDQYKYHPAVVYSAPEASAVSACAEGKVVDIYQDSKLGTVLVMDMGDGYQATYGQLCNIQVAIGDYVEAGENIGEVSAPTKYYSLEGSNLYFMVTVDGESVDPEGLVK